MGVWYGAAKKYELAVFRKIKGAAPAARSSSQRAAMAFTTFIATLASDAYSIIFIVFVIIMFVSGLYITIKRAAKATVIIL
jgi:ABC-type antimicrobial peptide transport system permease subunit